MISCSVFSFMVIAFKTQSVFSLISLIYFSLIISIFCVKFLCRPYQKVVPWCTNVGAWARADSTWLRVTIVINIVMDSIYGLGSSPRFYCMTRAVFNSRHSSLCYYRMPICNRGKIFFLFHANWLLIVWCISFKLVCSIDCNRQFIVAFCNNVLHSSFAVFERTVFLKVKNFFEYTAFRRKTGNNHTTLNIIHIKSFVLSSFYMYRSFMLIDRGVIIMLMIRTFTQFCEEEIFELLFKTLLVFYYNFNPFCRF